MTPRKIRAVFGRVSHAIPVPLRAIRCCRGLALRTVARMPTGTTVCAAVAHTSANRFGWTP